MAFSDYIIFADESGSPFLSADAEDFPVFVLVFMIVAKDHYVSKLVPEVQRLKFDHVGHDYLILHERDIRRQSGQFAFLQVDPDVREAFIQRLDAIVGVADVTFACAIIDKKKLGDRYPAPMSPYDLALTFCMEKAAKVLRDRGEAGTDLTVMFEARGKSEDRHLELEFRRIADGMPRIGNRSPAVTALNWTPIFIDKRSNSTGLQLADLAARPLGLNYLRPAQRNRAVPTIMKKMAYPHPKVFPQ